MGATTLIFDFDGSLANTTRAAFETINRLAVKYKFKQVTEEEYDTLKQKSWPEICKYLKVPLLKVPQLLSQSKTEMFRDINLITPSEGLPTVVKALKQQNYPMGIMTSHKDEYIYAFLRRNDLDIFDFIYSDSSIWGKKSRLKGLLEKQRLAPGQVVYIGDETRDVDAAKPLKVKIIAVTWGYNSQTMLEKSRPDHIIHEPEELLKIIG